MQSKSVQQPMHLVVSSLREMWLNQVEIGCLNQLLKSLPDLYLQKFLFCLHSVFLDSFICNRLTVLFIALHFRIHLVSFVFCHFTRKFSWHGAIGCWASPGLMPSHCLQSILLTMFYNSYHGPFKALFIIYLFFDSVQSDLHNLKAFEWFAPSKLFSSG